MRFLPLFARRWVWGFVGDLVNTSINFEDQLNELVKTTKK